MQVESKVQNEILIRIEGKTALLYKHNSMID
jgi:sRNA-binding regulator protein Hfq